MTSTNPTKVTFDMGDKVMVFCCQHQCSCRSAEVVDVFTNSDGSEHFITGTVDGAQYTLPASNVKCNINATGYDPNTEYECRPFFVNENTNEIKNFEYYARIDIIQDLLPTCEQHPSKRAKTRHEFLYDSTCSSSSTSSDFFHNSNNNNNNNNDDDNNSDVDGDNHNGNNNGDNNSDDNNNMKMRATDLGIDEGDNVGNSGSNGDGNGGRNDENNSGGNDDSNSEGNNGGNGDGNGESNGDDFVADSDNDGENGDDERDYTVNGIGETSSLATQEPGLLAAIANAENPDLEINENAKAVEEIEVIVID